MPRPALHEDKKRKTVSISLKPRILELADETDNKSKFFEQSVEVCVGMIEIMKEIRKKKLKANEALEEIEDMMDAWSSQFEEKTQYLSSKSLVKSGSRKTGS